MKKYKLIIFILLLSTLTSYAAKGFQAKVYDEKNVNIMRIVVDYDNNKIKVITNNPDMDYIIVSRISTTDKTVLYIRAILAGLYNNGNYDNKKEETFIFDTKNLLFSTDGSTRKFKIELLYLERNL